MIKPEIILVGAGGHAHACIDVIEHQSIYNIAGLVGTAEELGDIHCGYSVIATDADLKKLAEQYQYAFIAVGQIRSATQRVDLYNAAIAAGFDMPTIIDPSARVSNHASVKAGTIVMQQVIVNAGASIGENCILNTKSLIEHDTTIESHCHISTGAILNGNVNVATGAFVGSGVIVKEGVNIGENALVGMGTTVRHDVNANKQFLGATTS